MERLTYKQAYDKIIDAYFKDEIKPFDAKFCFCGTLANGSGWYKGDGSYSYYEYDLMEHALLFPFHKTGRHPCNKIRIDEGFLFEGMCAALDVLKEIHIERGEDVDAIPEFKKRVLVNSINN